MPDLAITATAVVSAATNATNHIAGATITAGQMVYLAVATDRIMLADSNSGTVEARTPMGIALNGASTGQRVTVQSSGNVTMNAVLTAGVVFYMSDTPGGICPVADIGSGEFVCIVGIATSTTVMRLDIQASGVAL